MEAKRIHMIIFFFVLMTSNAWGFPNICDVIKTPSFKSCINIRKSKCKCGKWPFPRPCVRMTYYVPQSFIEVFHNPKETFFSKLPGAIFQLKSIKNKNTTFGVEDSDGTYSFHSHTLPIPFSSIFNYLACRGGRREKMCFDGMSEHLGSNWNTGAADKYQPKPYAWAISPKSCLMKGFATSFTGKENIYNGEGLCSFPINWLKIYPPSNHSVCNGWGIFFPRQGVYHGASQTIAKLMIASRMKSISSEVFRSMPSQKDEKWQMILPNASSCFNEGQNIGLLESPVKRVIEYGNLRNIRNKGSLFAIWKKVSCCIDYWEVPAFYGFMAALKGMCRL